MIKLNNEITKQILYQLKKLPYNDVIDLINELDTKLYPNESGISYLGGGLTEVYDDEYYEVDTTIYGKKNNKIGFIK